MKILENSIAIIAIWAVAIFKEFFSNFLSQKLNVSDSFIFFIGIIILSILIIAFLHFRKKLSVDIHVTVLKEDYQKKENACKGLVLILSAFNPTRYSELEKLKENQPDIYKQALKELDIDLLKIDDITQSNFGHPVAALKAHKSKLEHVWLLCTRSKTGRTSQSINFAPLLEKYINEKIGDLIEVHYDKKYTVLLDEDSSVCHESFKIIKKIYKDARKLGLKAKEMITDVTGGTKSINSGAILACLNRDENIQIIGTDYDEDGKFKGQSFPMIVEYKPSLLEAE